VNHSKKIQIQTLGFNRRLFLSNSQISKEDKDWLYPQMIQAIKKAAADSIILVFSPTKLSNLINYG